MTSLTSLRARVAGAIAVAGVALLVAACGSSGSTSKTTASTTSAASPAKGVAVMTAAGSHGTYLVGADGHAVYLFLADRAGKSNCAGACAKAWPPLLTKAKPSVAGNAKSSDVSTITRSDGTKQVTYHGHPLYYYAADTAKGTTNGQGVNGFGAKWWLVAPSGTAITSGASGSSGGSTGSSSASPGY